MSEEELSEVHPLRRPHPVLFIHGMFSDSGLLASWLQRLEAAGYQTHAPSLPGRNPTDMKLLGRIGVPEFVDAAMAARERLERPPIVIGHSLGALVAQRLAALTQTAALVLLAPVPPWMLVPQLRILRFQIPLMPAILAGRALMPPTAAFRAIPFSSLPRDEQDDLVPRMVPDAGRAFRSTSFGTSVVRVKRRAVSCPVLCVSGTADRNVAPWIHRRIARRYSAEHHVHEGMPHWIVADSLIDEVAPPVLDWMAHVTEEPRSGR